MIPGCRMLRVLVWKAWPGSSYRLTKRFTLPRIRSTPGIARTRPAYAWKASPASGQSRRALWQLPSPIPKSSRMAANWPLGLGWCRQYLRWLLVAGAMSVIRQAKRRGASNPPWLANIIDSKPTMVAAVALANKNARIVWALMKQGGTYQRPVTVPAV